MNRAPSSTSRRAAKPLIQALRGTVPERPPWWLMRQAGRYLPEYRELRAQARDFVDFCLTPRLAAEATLQPLRRFGMDAAILFADILLVPLALGQKVGFGDDGPLLQPLDEQGASRVLRPPDMAVFERVCETVRLVAGSLSPQTALIGFAGAPWTVATYMVEGGASRDFRRVKAWAYRDPIGFAALIDAIADATIAYVSGQISAGAEVVQLFDSWAGVVPEPAFERWIVEPTRRISTALKERFPGVPIIGFPRGAGLFYERYASAAGVDVVGLDPAVPPGFARDRLQPKVGVQGNLDPVLLLVGGDALARAVQEIRAALGSGRFVFNLGHGVLPQTAPEQVAQLAELLARPSGAG